MPDRRGLAADTGRAATGRRITTVSGPDPVRSSRHRDSRSDRRSSGGPIASVVRMARAGRPPPGADRPGDCMSVDGTDDRAGGPTGPAAAMSREIDPRARNVNRGPISLFGTGTSPCGIRIPQSSVRKYRSKPTACVSRSDAAAKRAPARPQTRRRRSRAFAARRGPPRDQPSWPIGSPSGATRYHSPPNERSSCPAGAAPASSPV